MGLQSPPPYFEAQQQRSATASPSASATVTTTPLVILPESRAPDGTLRLRGGPIEDRRVKWDDGVIDNEGMGKKSSKGVFFLLTGTYRRDQWKYELIDYG